MKAPLDKEDNLPNISFLTTSIFTEFDLQKEETDPELIEKLIKRAHDMAAEVIIMKKARYLECGGFQRGLIWGSDSGCC